MFACEIDISVETRGVFGVNFKVGLEVKFPLQNINDEVKQGHVLYVIDISDAFTKRIWCLLLSV